MPGPQEQLARLCRRRRSRDDGCHCVHDGQLGGPESHAVAPAVALAVRAWAAVLPGRRGWRGLRGVDGGDEGEGGESEEEGCGEVYDSGCVDIC